MLTFEEFKKNPELYGATQIIEADIHVYPHYVEYVKTAIAVDIFGDCVKHSIGFVYDLALIASVHNKK